MRRTPEAQILHAVLSAFEAITDAGYFLHDASGLPLERAEFYKVMTIGFNAALASRAVDKGDNETTVQPEGLRGSNQDGITTG